MVRSAAFLDGATEGVVVAFAVWTLLYQVWLVAQGPMLSLGWPWVVFALAVAVVTGGRRVRGLSRGLAGGTGSAALATPRWLQIAMVPIGALLVLCVVGREAWTVTPLATAATLVLGLQLFAGWREGGRLRRSAGGARRSPPAPSEAVAVAPWEHLVAALASIALGALSAFLLRPDADDVYYVNRAAWVAEHGTAATGDTMFGPNQLPSAYGGGVPTPSVEALQGVIAHMFGVAAPTAAYLMMGPLLSVLAGWATWCLVRTWAPRRAGVAFLLAMLFLLASGLSVVGTYSIGRIWQGKVAAYAILLPLTWTYLSRLAVRPSRHDQVFLLAAGIAFVGLTTTSALLAPVIAGAGLLAALLMRSRALAVGTCLFLAAPLLNAVVQRFGPEAVDTPEVLAATPVSVLTIAFGSSGALLLLGVGATVFGPLVIRDRARLVAASGSLATLACLFPGALKLAASVTGAGPIVWRLGIAMPTWALVGVLACAPLEAVWRRGRWRTLLSWLAPAAVGVTTFFAATWLWTPEAGGQLTSRPTWKVPQRELSDVRAVQRLALGPGLWLMPPTQMEILSISTAGPFAVVPRGAYLPGLVAPAAERDARFALFRLVSGARASPTVIARSMDVLDVAVACVPGDEPRARRILRAAAGKGLQRVGTMRCHVRTPT